MFLCVMKEIPVITHTYPGYLSATVSFTFIFAVIVSYTIICSVSAIVAIVMSVMCPVITTCVVMS